MVSIDTPNLKDIKEPVKLGKKLIGTVELGAGALLEKQFIQPIAQKIPIPIPEIVDGIELVVLGAIHSMTDHKDINNLIGGAIVSNTLRLSDRIIERIKGLITNVKGVKVTGTPNIQTVESYTDGGDFF